MLVGWWGTISIIVTPFILLNNLLRFIFTGGMKKPSRQITPNPSPFWVFTAVSGFLLIGLFLLSVFSSAFALSTYTTPTAPTAIVVAPTHIPTKVNTPTAQASNCITWNEITPSMSGRSVCVYGTVYSIYRTDETSTRIKFSSEPNTFFLYDLNYVYPDLKEGDCVMAEDIIELYDNKIPYMSVSDLFYCE